MYERFSDRARKVMAIANQQAHRFNQEYIAPEHLLLAICAEPECLAAKIVTTAGIDLCRVRLEVENLVKSSPDVVTMGKLPKTPALNMVIDSAIAQAREMNNSHLGTEHLLLGLLTVAGTTAFNVMQSLGVTLDTARDHYRELMGYPLDENQGLSVMPLTQSEIELVRRARAMAEQMKVVVTSLAGGFVVEKK